jgi:hypothetical protein
LSSCLLRRRLLLLFLLLFRLVWFLNLVLVPVLVLVLVLNLDLDLDLIGTHFETMNNETLIPYVVSVSYGDLESSISLGYINRLESEFKKLYEMKWGELFFVLLVLLLKSTKSHDKEFLFVFLYHSLVSHFIVSLHPFSQLVRCAGPR